MVSRKDMLDAQDRAQAEKLLEIKRSINKIQNWISSAGSLHGRQQRKQQCFHVLYGSDPKAAIEFAKTLPTQDENLWHVTYYYLATGMEGRADEADCGFVTAASAQEACSIVAQRLSSDPATQKWYMSCLTATRHG